MRDFQYIGYESGVAGGGAGNFIFEWNVPLTESWKVHSIRVHNDGSKGARVLVQAPSAIGPSYIVTVADSLLLAYTFAPLVGSYAALAVPSAAPINSIRQDPFDIPSEGQLKITVASNSGNFAAGHQIGVFVMYEVMCQITEQVGRSTVDSETLPS